MSPNSLLRLITLFVLIINDIISGAKLSTDADTTLKERIVTDISYVYDGVLVDYRYNESDTKFIPKEGGLLSVPGCPKSVEGYPWVYYGSPKKCYLAGEQGPCPQDQKLFIKAGSPYGFCNCECFEGKEISQEAEFCNSMMDGTEYVFMSETRQCYAVYDQGPCKSDQWLVKSIDKTNKTVAVCESRQCPNGQKPYYSNEDDETIGLKNFTCFAPIGAYAGPVSILPNDCDDGMKYSSLLQKCVARKFGFSIG